MITRQIIILLLVIIVVLLQKIQTVKYVPKSVTFAPLPPSPPPPLKTIVYDYDNTLVNQYTSKQIKPMVDQMIKDYNNGHKIAIVTSRYTRHTDEIKKMLEDLNLSDIPVIATNREPKSSYLLSLGADVFYDDQLPVLEEIRQNAPSVRTFLVLYEKEPKAFSFRDMIKEIV